MNKIIIITSLCLTSFHCAAATSTLASKLQSSAAAVSSSISANVSSDQAKQNSKLSLQLKIDALRAKMGSSADIETKMQLEKEIKQLQEQRQNI